MAKGGDTHGIIVREEFCYSLYSHKVSIALGSMHLKVAYKHMWKTVCNIRMATLKIMVPSSLAAILQLPLTLCHSILQMPDCVTSTKTVKK